MQGRQDLGNWDERTPGAPRLDRITESLAEMYTRGQEPGIGDVFAASSGPAAGRPVPMQADHEWAGNSRESIDAMLSTMSISGQDSSASDYDWYEGDDIRPRKNTAVILAGVLVGFVTIGIAGYGFYLLGQKEAVLTPPEVPVVNSAPGVAAPEGGDSEVASAIRKDLSRIAEGEKAHVSPEPGSTTDMTPVIADSAASLKTDLQPVEALKEVLSDSGKARGDGARAGVEPEVAKASAPETAPVPVGEAVSGEPDVKSPDRKNTGKIVNGEDTASPAKAPAVLDAAPVKSAKVSAGPDRTVKRAARSAMLSKAPAAVSPVPSGAAVEAPVTSNEAAARSEKPGVHKVSPVSLESLSKSVVLAIVALGKQTKGSATGENPAAVLRVRMTQLVAEAAQQGKSQGDVELMLEHALAGVPTGTIPDVLKDVRGKVNVKMLLSSINPADTGR